ncbi:protein NPGR1 [Phalaenopsis equestris]|uniref:protein NPGR1 n=1 Tax=Phalaenopsis equestris TaxID=78828 RepID=UPI0009E211EE|nr:protein NPGR1 [Phalaenopsis equestris]
MLCACSGERERIHFDEVPQSPESLATRDFSADGLSSRNGDWEAKVDIGQQIDDVESALREGLSLNYEEARALLGRLEYQKGNFDAALQVFQGIDVPALRPRMVKAIVERTRLRKVRSKVEISPTNLMSWHSVSLLLEAVFLKSKSLEELGRLEDAAVECKTILDIVESAWSDGVPISIGSECKLKEIFHKALDLLPRLWQQAGLLDEAVAAYRRALTKPWDLGPQRCASLQKDLAITLLYGGSEVTLPAHFQQHYGSRSPDNNIEEAILLLIILIGKAASQEISWDPEVMDHLTFVLSFSGQLESLAGYVENMLPGMHSRRERWYFLSLCYSAAGLNDTALNILRKALGQSEKKKKDYFLSLVLGAKLCLRNPAHAEEGLGFALRAIKCSLEQQKHHLIGVANHLVGSCYRRCAKSSKSDSERLKLERESLNSLQFAATIEKKDAELIYSIALEHAMQRNHGLARDYAIRYLDMTAGCSVRGWTLLALVVSAEQNLKEAETIVDLSIDESGKVEQMELLRLKAFVQVAQEDLKGAVETYRFLLALIQARGENQSWRANIETEAERRLERETWLDLAMVYTKLGLWSDSNICLNKAKSLGHFYPRIWHATGNLFAAQSLHKDALAAFSMSLSIESDYVPSMVSAAAVLRKLGDRSLPIARSFLMNALQVDPTSHDAWLNLGFVAKSEGSLQKASDCFQAAYELRMTSPVMNFM